MESAEVAATRRDAAQAELREEQTERAAAQRADRRLQQAQTEHPAAEMELRTIQLREQVARVEAAAQEAEDYARLSPRERSERRGAHLLLDATPAGEEVQIEAVSLATIQDKLSIGRTTASELRIVALGPHPGRLPPLTRHQDDGGRHPHRAPPSDVRGGCGRGRRHGQALMEDRPAWP